MMQCNAITAINLIRSLSDPKSRQCPGPQNARESKSFCQAQRLTGVPSLKHSFFDHTGHHCTTIAAILLTVFRVRVSFWGKFLFSLFIFRLPLKLVYLFILLRSPTRRTKLV